MITPECAYHYSRRDAADRHTEYLRDADLYRAVEYGRYHSTTRAFSKWLGNRLLEWGRKLRERDGQVTVSIAFQTRSGDEKHAA
jgi:hypothetical protein